MDRQAEELLRRFVEIETAEQIETTYRDGTAVTARRPHARVTEFLPDRGVVVIAHDGRHARLQCDEADLLHVLSEVTREEMSAWGPGVPVLESAARYLSVWLDECLATREQHPSGWWTLRDCWFEARPPWEAPADR